MTITVAEITLSNKAKGKEEIEMLKKKEWEMTGSIGMWQTTFFSLHRSKVSSDVQQQLLCKFYANNFKLMNKGYLHYSLASKFSIKNIHTLFQGLLLSSFDNHSSNMCLRLILELVLVCDTNWMKDLL